MSKSRIIAVVGSLPLFLLAIFLPNVGISLIASAIIASITVVIIQRSTDDPEPVIRIFLFALGVRLITGMLLHYYDLRSFFGGDANTYDNIGYSLSLIWNGQASEFSRQEIFNATRTTGSGWGMGYFVGALYWLFGRNILLPQTICGTIGAAIVPAVYFCSQKIFANKRVSLMAAYAVAFFPAMVIWSSQLLKDGIIIFFLVVAMIMVMKLQEKLDVWAIIILGLCLFGILSIRFYIFYMVSAAVLGTVFIGRANSKQTMAARISALIILGVGLTYFGVIRLASNDLEKYGDLKSVQLSRLDLAKSADSGFGSEVDVSTPTGAIATLPIGLTYLFLAPFPWEAKNLRQAITIPETLIWWGLIPLIFSGVIYTVRNRLRRALPIVIFSLMLTLAYSIFQGNVGTAYRQRTQIQVFLFIFAAVGFEIIQEKRRDRQLLSRRQRDFERQRFAGGH